MVLRIKQNENDDWDKLYKDNYMLSSAIKTDEADTIAESNKIDKAVDIEKLTKENAAELQKMKRKKEHFFYGKIKFSQ